MTVDRSLDGQIPDPQSRERRIIAATESRPPTPSPQACPLCQQAARVTDWRFSHFDWLVVEGCGCGDFFVSAALFDERLPRLSAKERRTLSLRIRWFRANGSEAWCTTIDGTESGPLDIRQGRETVAAARQPSPHGTHAKVHHVQ